MATITPVNPNALPRSPFFSQATIAAAGRTLYIGGQNGLGEDGTALEGAGAQTTRALENVLTILSDAGATADDVAKVTVYFVDGADLDEAIAAMGPAWPNRTAAISVIRVAGLVVPGTLVEIEAVAMLP